MDPGCQQGTMQSGHNSIIVWYLLVYLNTYNNDQHIALLCDNLHHFMDTIYSNNNAKFLQDNECTMSSVD